MASPAFAEFEPPPVLVVSAGAGQVHDEESSAEGAVAVRAER